MEAILAPSCTPVVIGEPLAFPVELLSSLAHVVWSSQADAMPQLAVCSVSIWL